MADVGLGRGIRFGLHRAWLWARLSGLVGDAVAGLGSCKPREGGLNFLEGREMTKGELLKKLEDWPDSTIVVLVSPDGRCHSVNREAVYGVPKGVNNLAECEFYVGSQQGREEHR